MGTLESELNLIWVSERMASKTCLFVPEYFNEKIEAVGDQNIDAKTQASLRSRVQDVRSN